MIEDQSSMIAHTVLQWALFVFPLTWAQFPAVCNTPDSLSTKTCCPDNCGSHGTCVSVREEVERSWESANTTIVQILRGLPGYPQDVRYQWPLNIFESVCSCSDGWGGHDCSQCDFGYIANEAGECVKRNKNQLFTRRNFKNLSEQDRHNLVMLIAAAKNEERKEWATIASMPEESNGYYNLQNVSTYDMMEYIHFLAAKATKSPYSSGPISSNDTTSSLKIRFAHAGPLFLPWHRYYIMKFESELRRIGEKMGINDFTLPYWDWTPTSSCLMFTHELFGTPQHSEELVYVSGTLFENGKWPVVCDQFYMEKLEAEKRSKTQLQSATKGPQERILCDIEGDRMANRHLQRGAWKDTMHGVRLPDYKLIAMTLTPDQIEGTFGFENRLEIHLDQCAGEAVKCMYQSEDGLNIHSCGHYLVGGQLAVGESAANDPIFFPHHANVDRIFECWLQKYNGTPPSYQPISGGPPGHNIDDYLVPMFPLRKIADFYKESKELGYMYDDLPWDIPSTDYQVGCPSEQCDKGGYPPTVLVNSTSAYCTKIGTSQKSTNGGDENSNIPKVY